MTGGMSEVYVPSLSDLTRRYRVVQKHDGGFICECPKFAFTKTCNHIGIVERADSLSAKCAEAHGTIPAGVLCRACLVRLLALTAGKVRREYVTKTASKEKVAAARKKRTRKPKVKQEDVDAVHQ